MTDLQPFEEATGSSRTLQMFVLLLILVILPLGTLYYTSSGNDYFKEMISELHEYGEIPAFEFAAHNGQTMTTEKLKDKVIVSAFFSLKDPSSKLLGTQVKKLHEKFDDKNEVLFLLHTLSPETDNIGALQAFAQSAGLTDEEQCYLLSGSKQSLHDYVSKGFKWPADYGSRDKTTKMQFDAMPTALSDYPYIVIADKFGMIRNYYDFKDNLAMARLVEHLALLLPSRVGNDPELKRDLEK